MPEQPPLPDTVNENAGNSGLDADEAPASSPGTRNRTAPVELRQPPGEAEGTPTQPAPPEQAPSGTAGRNLLYGEIARGGMGAVLKGRDPALGRDLAVKVLLEAHRDNPELVGRFLEEAQIGGQLQHPGVVPVYELGQFEDDRPFFTMKLVKGQTLATRLLQRTSPREDLPRLLTIFEQVCQTVAYAHARGVIHRDLKPANVMVGSFGEVQVMDWGMAKVLPQGAANEKTPPPEDGATVIRTARSGSGSDLSQAGTVLGTPAFMPPEQANGEIERLDERADVFGLGAILCAILAAQPPYADRSKDEVFRKAQRGDLAEAFARLDGCGADAELVRLCKDCLAPERDDRPRNAGVVAQRVAAYQAGVQERLHSAELERAAAEVKAAEERKRRRLTAALAAAVLALVAGGALGGLYFQHLAEQRRTELALQDAERRHDAESALEKALGLREKARWGEARLVLEQARDRLGEAGPEELRQRLGQALGELDLVARLDDIRQNLSVIVEGEFDTGTALREYQAAFAGAGLGQVGDDEEAVAARVRGSTVWPQLVAALDHWAAITPRQEDRLFRWLLGVARRADPDPAWGDQFRDPAVRRDRAALERLAREAKVEQLSPQVVTALGGALLSAGADAVPLLTNAQRLHPDDFWLSFTLGHACLEVKKWEEAVSHLRAARALQPQSAAARNTLGYALHEKGQRDEAIQEYREALRLDPNFVPARYNLGHSLHEKGEREEAIQEYREALRLNPKYAKAHGMLGIALGQKGQRDEAIKEFRAALAIDPKSAHAHYNLGNALYEQGDREGAVKEYKEAIRLDPRFTPARTSLGNALYEQGDREGAVKEYKEAIRLDPNAPTHYNLGNALRDKGQLDEAAQEFRATLELDPKYAEAHCNLGHVLRRQGKFAEALASLRRGHELGSQGRLGATPPRNGCATPSVWSFWIPDSRRSWAARTNSATTPSDCCWPGCARSLSSSSTPLRSASTRTPSPPT
jgi:serine/threonine-protein kinase